MILWTNKKFNRKPEDLWISLTYVDLKQWAILILSAFLIVMLQDIVKLWVKEVTFMITVKPQIGYYFNL